MNNHHAIEAGRVAWVILRNKKWFADKVEYQNDDAVRFERFGVILKKHIRSMGIFRGREQYHEILRNRNNQEEHS